MGCDGTHVLGEGYELDHNHDLTSANHLPYVLSEREMRTAVGQPRAQGLQPAGAPSFGENNSGLDPKVPLPQSGTTKEVVVIAREFVKQMPGHSSSQTSSTQTGQATGQPSLETYRGTIVSTAKKLLKPNDQGQSTSDSSPRKGTYVIPPGQEIASKTGEAKEGSKGGVGSNVPLSTLTGAELVAILNAGSKLSRKDRIKYYHDVLIQLDPTVLSARAKELTQVQAQLGRWKTSEANAGEPRKFAGMATAIQSAGEIKDTRLGDIDLKLSDLNKRLAVAVAGDDTDQQMSIQSEIDALKGEKDLLVGIIDSLKNYCKAREGFLSFLKSGDLKLTDECKEKLAEDIIPFVIDEKHYQALDEILKQQDCKKPDWEKATSPEDSETVEKINNEKRDQWYGDIATKLQPELETAGFFESLGNDQIAKEKLTTQLVPWMLSNLAFYNNFVRG